jgi:hypothetical protein
MGRDPGDVAFYLGLAGYKLSVIMEGIRTRHLQGKTVGSGFDVIGAGVEPLLRSGIEALREEGGER